MKHLNLFILALVASSALYAQDIRVISNTIVANGFEPRLSADGQSLVYLEDEHYSYVNEPTDSYVSNEGCHLYLHQGESVIELTPDGNSAHYIWSSLSPDGTKIVYNTQRGTSICDLEGNVIGYYGHLNAPVWYGNDYLVGMYDHSEGARYTQSSIQLLALDHSLDLQLTNPDEKGMYPSASFESGRIAYSTLDGDVHLLQLNLTDNPISYAFPSVQKAPAARTKAPKKVRDHWDAPSDVKIYINPGHGGHGSNDRNIVIYPFKSGDPEGFWESNSNLDKGLQLRDWLEAMGFQVMMSRVTNNDGGGNDIDILKNKLSKNEITQEEYDYMLKNGDDRSLSAIAAEANAYDADFMLSIHSNAGSGVANYVLMLYAGKDESDTKNYASGTPVSNESRAISTIIGNNLQKNTITNWTVSTPNITGDKSFATRVFGWSDGYGVLRGLKVPGLISEGSMHDYIPETYRLMNMDYKYKESWYFMKSFCKYFLNMDLQKGVIGGQVRDDMNQQLFPSISAFKNTRDKLNPLNRATIELLKDGKVISTYTTDTLYNGIFFFWDLDAGEYTLRSKTDGYYTSEKIVTVEASEITYQDMMLSMERRTRPQVISYSPNVELTDSIEVKTSIIMNFNWDMMPEQTIKALHISPEVEGTAVFSNSQRTLTFTPTNYFEPGVEYTVTLDTLACHPDSNFLNHLEQPFSFKFRTKNRPHLMLQQIYPANGAVDIPLQPSLIVVTDAELASNTTAKCASLFSLTSEDGTFTYAPSSRYFKKNMVAAPLGAARVELTSPLQPNTTYTFTISGNLTDLNGVALGEDYSVTFTTAADDAQKQGQVIIPCDTISFDVNYEKSLGVTQKRLLIEKVKTTEGTASNHLSYTFAEAENNAYLFLQPRDLSYRFNSQDAISIDLFGDLTDNLITLEFSDEGDIHLIDITELDYCGWNTFVVPLSDLPQGVEYQLTGIRISRGNSPLSATGDIYIDRIARIKDANTDVQNIQKTVGQPIFILLDNSVLIENNEHIYNLQGQQIR